jgi:hypothetical protein
LQRALPTKAAPATLPIDFSGLPRPYDQHGDIEIVPPCIRFGPIMLAGASGEAQSPFLRIPGRVKHGVNRYCRFRVLEEDGIRKSPYQGPAVFLMNAGVDRGLPANALHGRIDGTQKLLAKPYSATLIPNVSFGNVEFGFWRNNRFSGHTGRAPFV